MRLAKASLAVLLLLFSLIGGARAADLTYPFGQINIKLPPTEDPIPGMGNYYCALSQGMKSALWNPASLAKLKLSETSLSMVSAIGTYNVERTTKLTEISKTYEAGGTSGGSAGEYALYFRTPANIASSGISAKEISILSSLNYATSGTGMNFSSALKINDWLAVGFAANNPLEINANLAGDFPTTARANTNLYGQTIDKMKIAANTGKLTYTFSSGGIVTTYETTKAIWGGFLTQEATVPLTTVSELRNNLNFQSPYTGTIASKMGNFCVGMNLVPISASANIDNDLHTVINSNTSNVFLYVPNFDSNNQSELANWVNDSDKYGSESGYERKQIRLPAGEIIAAARYRGFYSASTARFDLGATYDPSDWFTVGFALENSTGSTLNFKGNGLASYITYREINTAEASNLQDVLSPGGKKTLDFISNRWVTTYEVSGTGLYLEPDKTYALPKKIRLGFALKKPFLIAVDFEQNQTPLTITGSPEATFSNLNFLRLGLESQLLNLPFWARMGFTFMLKPSVAGGAQATQDSINSLFKYSVLPVKLDFGSTLNLWGVEISDSFGFNALSLINLAQFDTAGIDLNKAVYFGLSVKRNVWEINYLSQFDAVSTAAAYNNKPVGASGSKKFEVSDVKMVQTLGVTYRF